MNPSSHFYYVNLCQRVCQRNSSDQRRCPRSSLAKPSTHKIPSLARRAVIARHSPSAAREGETISSPRFWSAKIILSLTLSRPAGGEITLPVSTGMVWGVQRRTH